MILEITDETVARMAGNIAPALVIRAAMREGDDAPADWGLGVLASVPQEAVALARAILEEVQRTGAQNDDKPSRDS